MVNALNGGYSDNIGSQFYSISQNSNYDSEIKDNVVTTKLVIGDENLSNLSEADRAGLQEKILELAKKLNDEMSLINTNLMFDYEDSISSLTLTIKQRETGEIIRKIPSDEVIELMKQMRDIMSVVLDTRG